MPKEAIDLGDLLDRIVSRRIKQDVPLVCYKDSEGNSFDVFQNSGLNVVIGAEGNGKTKLLTSIIIKLLDTETKYNILYVDTERPESQYAYTIKNIAEKCKLLPKELVQRFFVISAMDLTAKEIRESITSFLTTHPEKKFIIVIDHILPLVDDMNNVLEAVEIDRLLKGLNSDGHVIIVSIHKPVTSQPRGLGHLGSAMQRAASFIVEIANNPEGTGFIISQVKSRISGLSNDQLQLLKDDSGNIDNKTVTVSNFKKKVTRKAKNTKEPKEILNLFLRGNIHTKKELLAVIGREMTFTNKSTSSYDFFNQYFIDAISFDKNGYTITDNGKLLLGIEPLI